ncbi:CRISPR-associated protein Csd1 [Ruminococcaceae bacterium FB2012]|nr:CRISPR-associated protein Csd1 [Ruminococcaceae bacterium FB2012]
MGWTNELYKVYERAVGTEKGKSLLPISHSTAQAQIEVTVDEDGEFISASVISKENATTIIPVTEDSAARSSGITPMPLADKLVYIAGDYGNYVEGKRADNTEYFGAYIKQLSEWCESEYSSAAIKAIYTYLSKKELMKDLINSNVLELDENSRKLTKKKMGTVSQEEYFVRFIVNGKEGVCCTWNDENIHRSFISYYNEKLECSGLCYADGSTGSITSKHPAKIRNSGDKSKLISANDTSNFTYRGRFTNANEAVSVSYEFSQKMHNALKWLIERERKTKTDKNGKEIAYNPMVFDSLTLVVWNSALDFVPDITESLLGDIEEEEYSSKPVFAEMLHKKLMGGKSEFDPDSKVMVMGLDSATTGRLSISMYTELAESRFVENLEFWHSSTAWARKRYIKNKYESITDSCSLPQITNCLYGTEQGAFLECDKKVLRDTILRLLPCVTERRKLPRDIVQTLYNRASNPLAFSNEHNHRMIVENTCALIRKEYSDYEKGEIKMAFDPNCTDRSYLFGCLLAIADKAERDTYEKDEKRITNARRFWNAFSSRPYQTWQIIEERLEPYLEKETWVMTKYTKHFNEIMSKMSPEDFADNSKLSPLYLIGFHHYNALLWNGSEDKNEEE